MRIGSFLPWKSRWFVEGEKYKEFLMEDVRIRYALMDKLKLAGITSVEIERLPKSMVLNLTVSRPGVVIGRGGSGIEEVKKYVLGIIKSVRGELPKDLKIDLKVTEVKNAEISRVEKFQMGSVPTQTLRETIDYAQIPALLKRGYVGVKVWIHRKEE